jgi:hypothetical protein
MAATRSLFDDDALADALLYAPNPKPSTRDKKGFGRLASLYTAFSTEFAAFATELCLSRGHRRIADPFAGMGTLGEAARTSPVQLVLNDFNPFAVASCCMRVSTAAETEAAIGEARSLAVASRGEPEGVRFKLAADQLLPPGRSIRDCLKSLNDLESLRAVRALHLLALARIAMHKRLKGSNPTWTKRLHHEAASGVDFDEALEEVLAYVRDYAGRLPTKNHNFSAALSNDDVTDLDWENGSLDAIITSPPYPNRTDYIRHYLPAAEFLLDGDQGAERHLREVQIGTPLIRSDLPSTHLPSSVEALIERVRSHRSYASERYYAKGFRYYFDDMMRTLAQFSRWLAPKGILILVVQDTYYKEVLVPVADLLIDIAASAGLEPMARQNFKVRHPLSRLSPHSRAAMPKRQLHETALLFVRS